MLLFQGLSEGCVERAGRLANLRSAGIASMRMCKSKSASIRMRDENKRAGSRTRGRGLKRGGVALTGWAWLHRGERGGLTLHMLHIYELWLSLRSSHRFGVILGEYLGQFWT